MRKQRLFMFPFPPVVAAGIVDGTNEKRLDVVGVGLPLQERGKDVVDERFRVAIGDAEAMSRNRAQQALVLTINGIERMRSREFGLIVRHRRPPQVCALWGCSRKIPYLRPRSRSAATVAAAWLHAAREFPFRLPEALFSTRCGRVAHHQSTSPDLGVTERRQSLPSEAKKVEKGADLSRSKCGQTLCATLPRRR